MQNINTEQFFYNKKRTEPNAQAPSLKEKKMEYTLLYTKERKNVYRKLKKGKFYTFYIEHIYTLRKKGNELNVCS